MKKKDEIKKEKSFKINKRVCIMVAAIVVVVLAIFGFVMAVRSKAAASSPVGMTEEYLKKYKKLDESVVKDIRYSFSDKLTPEQEKLYVGVIKKQYQKLNYSITEQNISDMEATVEILVTVTDLKDAYEEATTYVDAHRDKFLDASNEFDVYAATDYKLEQLENASSSVEYAISFYYYKNDLGKWVMKDLHDADIQKIAGTF